MKHNIKFNSKGSTCAEQLGSSITDKDAEQFFKKLVSTGKYYEAIEEILETHEKLEDVLALCVYLGDYGRWYVSNNISFLDQSLKQKDAAEIEH